MNSFVFFAFLIGSAYCTVSPDEFPPSLVELATKLHANCQAITGVADESINAVKDGHLEDPVENLMRYNTCLWLMSQALDATFVLNEQIISDNLPPSIKDEQLQVVRVCYATVQVTDNVLIDKCWAFTKCIYNAKPENWIYF